MANTKGTKKKLDSMPPKPRIPPNIDLASLKPHNLNKSLEGLPEDEWEAVEANAFCCGLCDDSDFVQSQVDLIEAEAASSKDFQHKQATEVPLGDKVLA